jgi:hypothetical protein
MSVVVNVAISVDADNKEVAIQMIKNMSDRELLKRNHILSIGNIDVRTVSFSEKRVVA